MLRIPNFGATTEAEQPSRPVIEGHQALKRAIPLCITPPPSPLSLYSGAIETHPPPHVHCEEEVYDYNNTLEINYNRQLTSSMNHNYARELPSHYLKHWGLLVDTGAYVSVAPKHFAPEVPLEPVPHPVQLLTATSTPIKIYGTKIACPSAGVHGQQPGQMQLAARCHPVDPPSS